MITLFIFKSSSRGTQYGIGTYISELTNSLQRNYDLLIYLVSYNNSSVKELTVNEVTARFIQINIPSPQLQVHQIEDFEKKYAATVVRLLSDFISGSEVIFQLNYIDDLEIGRLLKKKYEHPLISIVHFSQYQQLFNGNRNMSRGLNLENPSDKTEFTLFSEKELYMISDHVVSVTAYMKDFLCQYYKIDPDKISIIPNGLDHTCFQRVSEEKRIKIRRDLGFEKEDIICLFSGRIDQCKGVGFLLPAFEEACRTADNLKLVLLGQGTLQEFQSKIQTAFGRIIFTGFLSKQQVKNFYQIVDIGIIPSVYDHCPYSALEMIASGVPLIMARIEGLNEILDDTECVFIDPITNENGEITYNIINMAEMILKLAWNEELRNIYSDRAFRKLMKRGTSARLADSMYSVLQNVLRIKKLKS